MKHFKNPVSMRVPSQEAFERDLRKPLEELGAKFGNVFYFKRFPILVSNLGGENGIITNYTESHKSRYNRHFIETYDPEQFIAICKLEVEMKVGECYTVVFNYSGRKMIGYLLENNKQNHFNDLKGYFQAIDFKDKYHEKEFFCYYSGDRTIRLSTPEEKAKLDKVIAEQIEVKDAIIVTSPIDKVKSDLKQAKKKVKLLTEVLKYLENEQR